nr:hypothetical protein [Tanacetum cinerariifolium]
RLTTKAKELAMFSKSNILAAKGFMAAAILSALVSQSANAGIPVLDSLGLTQTTVSAINQVKQNVNYYRNSPCFTPAGCTEAEAKAVQDAQANNSEAVKRANDAVLKSVDQQQQTLTSDAANLQKLQSQATSARG